MQDIQNINVDNNLSECYNMIKKKSNFNNLCSY